MREHVRDVLNAIILVCVGLDGFWFAMRFVNGDGSWLYIPTLGVMLWCWAQLGETIEKEVDNEHRQRRD